MRAPHADIPYLLDVPLGTEGEYAESRLSVRTRAEATLNLGLKFSSLHHHGCHLLLPGLPQFHHLRPVCHSQGFPHLEIRLEMDLVVTDVMIKWDVNQMSS